MNRRELLSRGSGLAGLVAVAGAAGSTLAPPAPLPEIRMRVIMTFEAVIHAEVLERAPRVGDRMTAAFPTGRYRGRIEAVRHRAFENGNCSTFEVQGPVEIFEDEPDMRHWMAGHAEIRGQDVPVMHYAVSEQEVADLQEISG